MQNEAATTPIRITQSFSTSKQIKQECQTIQSLNFLLMVLKFYSPHLLFQLGAQGFIFPVDSSDLGGELSFLTAAACAALHIHSSPLITAAGVPLQICPWPLNVAAPDGGQSRSSPLKTIPSCSATSTAVRLVPTAGEPSGTRLSPTSSKFVDLCHPKQRELTSLPHKLQIRLCT